jgi:hypothetical protein
MGTNKTEYSRKQKKLNDKLNHKFFLNKSIRILK